MMHCVFLQFKQTCRNVYLETFQPFLKILKILFRTYMEVAFMSSLKQNNPRKLN